MRKRNLEVHLVQSTPNAERLLSFAKDTRLLGDEGYINDETTYDKNPVRKMMHRHMPDVRKNVEYSLNTIRGPLEFIHYVFLITNGSRAFQQQLTRHRVVSFAIQSLRVSDKVGYYSPPGIEKNEEAKKLYDCHIINCQNSYDKLISLGIDMQDARGVLPLNTSSAVLLKINLRAFLEMMEIRLCLRIQGENRSAMTKMKEIVLKTHPWLAGHIGPVCATKGICAFPRYKCPISKAYPALKGMPEHEKADVARLVENFGDIGLAPKAPNERPGCFGHYQENKICDAEKARACGVSPECRNRKEGVI